MSMLEMKTWNMPFHDKQKTNKNSFLRLFNNVSLLQSTHTHKSVCVCVTKTGVNQGGVITPTKNSGSCI